MQKLFYFLLNIINPIFNSIYSDRLRVLAYHDIKDKSLFADQIKYLSARYNIIDIEQLKAHLFEGHKLPKKALLITFDDGDISVLDYGLPILKKYNATASIFIITNLIGTNNPFWWEEIKNYLGNSEGERMVWEVKKMENFERIDYIKKLRATFENLNNKFPQLSLRNIYELVSAGIFIGNHSHSHPMFNMCTFQEIQEELDQSIEKFVKWNLEGYDIFAYPNGNHDEKTETILKRNNIKIAFLFDHKVNKKEIDSLKISRIRVNADSPMLEFKAKVSGVHSFIYNLRN